VRRCVRTATLTRALTRAPPAPQVPLMVSADALAAALRAAAGVRLPLRPAPPRSQLATAATAAAAARVPPPVLAAASRAVALLAVRGGAAWGSAVCISADGFLLTAAHIVHPEAPAAAGPAAPRGGLGGAWPELPEAVEAADAGGAATGEEGWPALPRGASDHALVRLRDGRWRRAATLWVSHGALDLALLRLDGPLPREGLPVLALGHEADDADALAPGAPCAVLGHALFAPAAGLPPAAAAGVVARCVAPTGAAAAPLAMLLTSAAVHGGASGGAVVGARGTLLGLVTSNAHAAGAAAPMPQLNFSVAAPALRRLCAAAAASGAGAPGAARALRAACAALDASDAHMAALWALQPAPAQPAQPPPGPRLAAFLATLRDAPPPQQPQQPRSRL
jgi:S1-C subfamily serine protease